MPLIAEELRDAQQALNEITGEFTSEDLLGRIFSSFVSGSRRCLTTSLTDVAVASDSSSETLRPVAVKNQHPPVTVAPCTDYGIDTRIRSEFNRQTTLNEADSLPRSPVPPSKEICKNLVVDGWGDGMSLVHEIMELTAAGEQDVDRNIASELKQLEQLEEVERALRSVGVTLKPTFNVSLAARIGAVSKGN
jgi:hypothetical protein